MNILHVVSNLDPQSGGPAEALRGLATAQAGTGMSVSVLATFRRGADISFADALRAAGVVVALVGPCYGPLCWRPGLGATVRAAVRGADIVHIHALWEDVQHHAAGTARRLAKPFLIRPCGMLDPWSLAQGRLKKRLYLRWRLRRHLNRAAALHFTTPIERDLTAPLSLSAPSIVEPNGIRLDEFRTLPPRGGLRARHRIPNEVPVCLFLGRVHYKKGLDLLLPAFAAAGGPAHLVVAGPDPDGYGAALQADAQKLGIADHVHFVGMLRGAEKLEALADADLFVLPSRQENFGNAVIEALAAGVPVIVSDQVNLWPDIKEAGVGGVVPLSVPALAGGLREWLGAPGRRATVSPRARQLVRDRYDWAAIARRWAAHYARMIGTGG